MSLETVLLLLVGGIVMVQRVRVCTSHLPEAKVNKGLSDKRKSRRPHTVSPLCRFIQVGYYNGVLEYNVVILKRL